jgi:hypothetical protein
MHYKAISSTPSHLSSFSISFGVFLRGASFSLTLDSFFIVLGLTLDTSHRVITIT